LPSPTRAAIEANSDREWHLREGEAAMTEPMRDPTNPPRILTPRKPLPPSRYGSLHPLCRREGRRPSSQHGSLRPGAGTLPSMTWMAVSMLVSDSEVRTRVCCKGDNGGADRIVVPAIE